MTRNGFHIISKETMYSMMGLTPLERFVVLADEAEDLTWRQIAKSRGVTVAEVTAAYDMACRKVYAWHGSAHYYRFLDVEEEM